MAAMRFMHIGRAVHFVGEVTAPSIRKGDGLLIVSGSGETPVSVGFARIAKAEGAEVVHLTHKPASTMAGIADVVLPVPVETTAQFGGSLFEQTQPDPARLPSSSRWPGSCPTRMTACCTATPTCSERDAARRHDR